MLALTSCPHWHSVFSSVFKEPKLWHILAAVFCLLGLVPVGSSRGVKPPWSEEQR
jgi:hypothetical protein